MNLPIGTITTKEMSNIPAEMLSLLTKRQKEVLGLLIKGYSNRMICDTLCLNESTVKFHITPMFKKFGVKSRLELITKLFSINKGSP